MTTQSISSKYEATHVSKGMTWLTIQLNMDVYNHICHPTIISYTYITPSHTTYKMKDSIETFFKIYMHTPSHYSHGPNHT